MVYQSLHRERVQVKLKPKLTITQGPQPWFVELRFDYNEQLKNLCKVPGSKWQPENKTWLVPIEMGERVAQAAEKAGYVVYWPEVKAS